MSAAVDNSTLAPTNVVRPAIWSMARVNTARLDDLNERFADS